MKGAIYYVALATVIFSHVRAETITKSLVNVNNSYPRSVLENSLPTLYWQSTNCDKQGGCKLVAQQFFEGAVLNNVTNLLKVGVNFNPVPMTGFKKEGMRSCTGENCVAKILGWFSNRTGTSVDDGIACEKEWTWLPVSNLPSAIG